MTTQQTSKAADTTHSQSVEAVVDAYDTGLDGLSEAEAAARLDAQGPNEVEGGGGRSAADILLTQFDSVLIWVLVGAAALSLWAGHAVDAVLIAVIVLANGLFGFVQDYRAEESLAALRDLAAPTARVRRDGETTDIAAPDLVTGDVVELTGGDVVPADARLVETSSVEVDEAALTGESVPVSKSAAPVETDAPLAERESMVYRGTNVTRGSGVAVVTATGMDTEVGAIAGELTGTAETETPLQRELDRLGRVLGLGVVVLAALVIPLLLARGTGPIQSALTAISLAVAAVPEGLPAVVTLTLALGVRRMADEDALVRRLPAVEALGAVDVVCTDKTGTLTEGQMSVTRCWVNDSVTEPTAPAGTTDAERLDRLLRAGSLCNDATADEGDPTEQAIVAAAQKRDIDVDRLRDQHPRTGEIPFSSERKWMGTVHGDEVFVKGAPAVVVEKSAQVLTAEGPQPLTDAAAERIRDRVDAFADDALRVLAVGVGASGVLERDADGDPEDVRDGLTFLGLVGMLDPPREEVAAAVEATRRAGIDVKMVTGDNARTAAAIGESLGLGGAVTTGRDIEALTEEQLRDRVESVDVFARTSPAQKVRILRALQAGGHIVAMTGDGVNDAPALKNADIGVAMGIRGTDVAKQASDIVLLDDDYATIERAIERGRAIFDNVWKFVGYLLSANVAEVAIVFIASLLGYLVLPAVQLLWINLLTDGLPALALGADPQSGDVMARSPRDPDRGIVDARMLGLIGGAGTVSTVAILGLLFTALDGAPSVTPYAMTMVFTAFVVLEFEKLYVIRWLQETPTLSNRWLAAAVGGSLALQLAVLYTPLNDYFGTVPLGAAGWGYVLALSVGVLPLYLAVALLVRRVGGESAT